MATRDIGQKAEQEACHFLEKKGLKLLERNFRCMLGEIDLIMQDRDEIVFIEVRMRSYSNFANAVESVNLAKQRKIIRTATLYLQKKNWFDRVQCRFDIFGISNNQTEWIKDAFSAELF